MIDAGEPDAAPPARADSPLHLRLTATGEVRVYRVPLVGANLDNFLRVTAERAPRTRIVIVAPKDLAHAKLMGVMQKVNGAGLREITISTTP
jgi:biopolymer transport protein ExbD